MLKKPFTRSIVVVMGIFLLCLPLSSLLRGDSADPAKHDYSKVVGPDKGEGNCASCHALEVEAWKNTKHYATFKNRHRSDRAKEILGNLGQKSMKRSGDCKHCHYTNITNKKGKVSAKWGVSCESCHSPSKDWLHTHYKKNGDPGADNLKWGTGKKGESDAERHKRLMAAHSKGMIHSEMIYDIAANCYGCHSVPNENLVNVGKHKAGSDFDLVAWSQGEIRHNFVSSAGAPDSPSNRASTAAEKRRLYVVGALVDLEFSLKNIMNVKEKGGDFHKAMIARSNKARKKMDAILSAADLPGIKGAVSGLPASVDESTTVSEASLNKLKESGRAFAKAHDGSKLASIDSLIPTQVKGQAHKE